MARNTAGTLMAPMSSPTLKCDRPKRETSSGTNGGTTKNVAPMAKKLKTEESRINQRRSAREEVVDVMEGIIAGTPAFWAAVTLWRPSDQRRTIGAVARGLIRGAATTPMARRRPAS